MHTAQHQQEYYRALLNKDRQYDGVFFVGVKTTGIFCHPTCPARKPKFENCEFFTHAQEALLAGYRPCQRCQPLSNPHRMSPLIAHLVTAVENDPEKRWKDADFRALGVDVSTARRQFKKRFGMTFVQYTRARRMGLALKNIRKGDRIMEAQLSSGYESASGFNDAFAKIMGKVPSKSRDQRFLKAIWFDSPLGPMLAIADEMHLYLLEFVDRRGLEREIERLRHKTHAAIVPGDAPPLTSIQHELKQYFAGKLQRFKTPFKMLASPFQQSVWDALLTIPYGQTWSYQELAKNIGQPTACRAVANANGANQLAIIIPCHRVINTGGALGGYGGGIARKQGLLNLEKRSVR